jgi:hypothetical protein
MYNSSVSQLKPKIKIKNKNGSPVFLSMVMYSIKVLNAEMKNERKPGNEPDLEKWVGILESSLLVLEDDDDDGLVWEENREK